MALVPLTQPGDIGGTCDEMWLELSCTGYRTSAATLASFTLLLTDLPTNGQSFTLGLPTGDVVFTFVSGTPDSSGLQVEIGADLAETRTNLYDALRANWFVDQLFIITTGSGTHTLTARIAGLVIMGFTDTTPGTITWTEVSAGSDAVYATNYNALVQLWVEDAEGANTYTKLPEVLLTPDKLLRRVHLDLHTFLKPKTSYDWPAYGLDNFVVLDKLKRRYYYTYWEQLGDPPTARTLGRGALKTAWFAGTRHIENNDAENIWSLIRRSDAYNPFLTYRGLGGRHEVSRRQAPYLAWYRRVAKVDDNQIKLVATVYYTDATSDTSTIWTDTNGSGYAQWRVGQWNVGFVANDLHLLDPDKTPVYYTIEVQNAASTRLSTIAVLHLVDTDANEIHVEYVNSLGVVESLRCKGSWQHGITPAHSAVSRMLFPVDGARTSEQEGNVQHLLDGAQQTLQVSTGFMDRGELNALVDVLVSPEWRWVDSARATLHPLRLVGGEEVMRVQGETNEHLYAFNLEFEVCDPEMAWSDRLNWPAMPEDPEAEREPEYAP